MISEPLRPATFYATYILKSWPISQLVDIKAPQRLNGIVILLFYYTIPFGFTLFRHIWVIIFNFWNYFVWLRITDEGSLSEMGIWSILLIKSDLKWCIHLSRSLFLYIHKKVMEKWQWRTMNLYVSSWTYTILSEAALDGEETSDVVVCGEGHGCTLPEEGPLASMTSSWLSSVRWILRLFEKCLYMDPVYDETFASVRGRIWKQHIWFRKPLEEGLKLALTLRHLVVGTMYSDMQYGRRVSENTLSDVFMEMCQAICDEYADGFYRR